MKEIQIKKIDHEINWIKGVILNKDKGYNHTKKHLPVKLVYFEMFPRIDLAFERENQIQGWRREKKLALIKNRQIDLPNLSSSKK